MIRHRPGSGWPEPLGRWPAPARAPRSRHPALEGLEDRQLLTGLATAATPLTPIGLVVASDPNPMPGVEGVDAAYHLTAGLDESSTVGQFLTTDGGSVTSAAVDWGDRTAATTGTVTPPDPSAGLFGTVTGEHTYTRPGAYAATVTLAVTGGPAVIVTDQITVDASAITEASAQSFTPATNLPGAGVQVATFVVNDPTLNPPDFTATIEWGDGTTSAGAVVSLDSNLDSVTGDHTYTRAGSYATSITITDKAGRATTVAGQAVVADESITGQGVPIAALRGVGIGQPDPVTVATFIDSVEDPSGANYSATIDWGDGTTSAGTILPAGPIDVTGDHRYAADGSYLVKVTLTSVAGVSASATGTATVAELQGSGSDQVTTPGSAIGSPIASFRSADPRATPGDFAATISWGDGTSPAAGVVGVDDPATGSFAVAGDHVYGKLGDYPLTITVADAAGNTTTITETVHVVDQFRVIDFPVLPIGRIGFGGPIRLTTEGGIGAGAGNGHAPRPITHPKGVGTQGGTHHHPKPPRPPAHHPRPTVGTPKPAAAPPVHLPPGVKPLGFFKPFNAHFRYPAPAGGSAPPLVHHGRPATPAPARGRHR